MDSTERQALLEPLQKTADMMMPIVKDLLKDERYRETVNGIEITRWSGFCKDGSDLIFKHFCPEECPNQGWMTVNNSEERYIAICCRKHGLPQIWEKSKELRETRIRNETL